MTSAAEHGAGSLCLVPPRPASGCADLPCISPGCPGHRVPGRRLRAGQMWEEVLSSSGSPLLGVHMPADHRNPPVVPKIVLDA